MRQLTSAGAEFLIAFATIKLLPTKRASSYSHFKKRSGQRVAEKFLHERPRQRKVIRPWELVEYLDCAFGNIAA